MGPDDLEKTTKTDPELLSKLSKIEDVKDLPPQEQELWEALWRKEALVSDLGINKKLQATGEVEKVNEFLTAKIPNYEQMVQGIVVEFKEEMKANMETLKA